MSRRGVAAVVIGGLLFTGWWVFGRQSPPDSSPSPASPAATTAATGQPTQASTPPTAAPDPSPTEAATPSVTNPSSATLPAAQQRQVEDFAVRFMKTFARPSRTVNSSTWWNRVAAMLTDDAADDYLGTDPALVPFRKVTGPASLIANHDDSDGFWLQKVAVPTDAGTYTVLVQLVTPGLSDRLLVVEIDEP